MNWSRRHAILKIASLQGLLKLSPQICALKLRHASSEEIRTAHNAAASHPWDWQQLAIIGSPVLLLLGKSSCPQIALASCGRVFDEGYHASLSFAPQPLRSTFLRLKLQNPKGHRCSGHDVPILFAGLQSPCRKGEIPLLLDEQTCQRWVIWSFPQLLLDAGSVRAAWRICSENSRNWIDPAQHQNVHAAIGRLAISRLWRCLTRATTPWARAERI